jgi:hypothetical protein
MSVSIEMGRPCLSIKLPPEVSNLEGLQDIKQIMGVFKRVHDFFHVEKVRGIRGYFINILNIQSLVVQAQAPLVSKKITEPLLERLVNHLKDEKSLKLLSIVFTVSSLSFYYFSHLTETPLSSNTSALLLALVGANLISLSVRKWLLSHPACCFKSYDLINQGLSRLSEEILDSPLIMKFTGALLLIGFFNTEKLPFFELQQQRSVPFSDFIMIMLISLCFLPDRLAVLLKDLSTIAACFKHVALLDVLSHQLQKKEHESLFFNYQKMITQQLCDIQRQKSKTLVLLEQQKQILQKRLDLDAKTLSEIEKQISLLMAEIDLHEKRPLESYLFTQEARSSPVTIVRLKSIHDLELLRRKESDVTALMCALELQKIAYSEAKLKTEDSFTSFQVHEERIKAYLKQSKKDAVLVYNEGVLQRHVAFFESHTKIKCLEFLKQQGVLKQDMRSYEASILSAYVCHQLHQSSKKASACFRNVLSLMVTKSMAKPLTTVVLSIIFPYAMDLSILLCPSHMQKEILYLAHVINLIGYISFFYQFFKTFKLKDEGDLVPRTISSQEIQTIVLRNASLEKTLRQAFSDHLQLFISCANEIKEGSFYEYEELFRNGINMARSLGCFQEKDLRIIETFLDQLSLLLGSDLRDLSKISADLWYFREMKKLFDFDMRKQLSLTSF